MVGLACAGCLGTIRTHSLLCGGQLLGLFFIFFLPHRSGDLGGHVVVFRADIFVVVVVWLPVTGVQSYMLFWMTPGYGGPDVWLVRD